MTASPVTPMRKSGFCLWPDQPGRSHRYCTTVGCDCDCHDTPNAEGSAT